MGVLISLKETHGETAAGFRLLACLLKKKYHFQTLTTTPMLLLFPLLTVGPITGDKSRPVAATPEGAGVGAERSGSVP